MVLWSVTLKIGALTEHGLFFSVVFFIHVFDQTLAEQLYREKCLFWEYQHSSISAHFTLHVRHFFIRTEIERRH